MPRSKRRSTMPTCRPRALTLLILVMIASDVCHTNWGHARTTAAKQQYAAIHLNDHPAEAEAARVIAIPLNDPAADEEKNLDWLLALSPEVRTNLVNELRGRQ